MVIKKNGKKLYPVCSWYANQHKLYYFIDKISIQIHENPDNDLLYGKRENLENLLNVFNENVFNGVVYANYEKSVKIKELITAYDLHH